MKRVNIGGQAVLEGVMMKGPDSYALAVRKPNQQIDVKVTEYKSMGEKHKSLNIPIIRGVVNFIESLYIGMKTLMDSSEYFEEEEASPSNTDNSSDKDKKDNNTGYLVGTTDRWNNAKRSEEHDRVKHTRKCA